MSEGLSFTRQPEGGFVAPTPQNTPLQNQPMTRDALSRPTVGTVDEEDEESAAANAPNEAIAAALAGNPQLSDLLGERLNKLNNASHALESLPDFVRRRVAALEGLQAQHLKVEAEFQKELMELERKFESKYAPLYQQRKEVVLGTSEPSAELVIEGEKATAERNNKIQDSDHEESLANVTAPADGKPGIPHFWLTVLHTHTGFGELISEQDEEALEYLQDIRSEQLPAGDKSGFKLTFEFSPDNKFFTNTTLTKTYFYRDTVGPNGDLIYDHAEGTKINWLEGKDLTTRIETKKQRNKHTNETRVVKRSVPTDSFFNFFNPPVPPSDSDDESDQELQELHERLEVDYQLGEDVKDRIVPHAIQFFTGEALNYEDFDDFDEGDDDEDEDDDDEEDVAPAAQTQGATAQSADPQECRQQ